MSIKRHVCRLPLPKKVPSGIVWISEDVLDSAISHFSGGRISKRHVGLAPGPLEARKRSAKRRMMNLSQVGVGVEIDPSLLHGTGRPSENARWQWQSPTLPACKDVKDASAIPSSMGSMPPKAKDSNESATWPRWLFNFDRKEERKSLPEDNAPNGNDQRMSLPEKQTDLEGLEQNEPVRSLIHPSTLLEGMPIFGPSPLIEGKDQSTSPFDHRLRGIDLGVLEALKMCASLDEIRTWATCHNVYTAKYSRLAFVQLCSLKPPLPTLLEALETAPFRHSRNLKHLLTSLVENPRPQADTYLLNQWVKWRASLGMLSELDISHLAHSVSSSSSLPSQEQWQCSLAESLFDGLQSSTILGLKDVKPKVFESIWRPIFETTLTANFQDVGTRMIKALQPSQAERMKSSIVSFVRRSFQAQATSQDNGEQEMDQLNAVPWAIDIIRSLPEHIAKLLVISICGALIKGNTYSNFGRHALVKLLNLWWSALARSGLVKFNCKDMIRTQVERMLGDLWAESMGNEPALAVITSYMRVLTVSGKARFILQFCYESDMSTPRVAKVLGRFTEWRRERPKEPPFVSMMQVAREQSMLEQHRNVQVFRLLQRLHMSKDLTHIISNAKDANYGVGEYPVIHAIRNHMRGYPQIAQGLFESCPQLPLEQCPELAENLIANPDIHPKWPLVYYRSRHPGPGIPSCREHPRTIQARARLLERMALAYARNMTLTHRMAFRKVYQCYKLHMDEGLGHLGTDMVSAFTLAGIIRQLQEGTWVSTEKIRWVLSLVRSVEDADVADQLDSLVYKWRGHAIIQTRARLHQEQAQSTSLIINEPQNYRTEFDSLENSSGENNISTSSDDSAERRLEISDNPP